MSKKNRQVNKAIAEADKIVNMATSKLDKQGRGVQVWTTSQLMGITGLDKTGQFIHGQYEQPIFYLSLDERDVIYRLCTPVFAVVSGRMNRIAALDFTITAESKVEDRTYEYLKTCHQIWQEYQAIKPGDSQFVKYAVVKAKMFGEIKNTLPDILPDCSNFQSALLRWKKRLVCTNNDKGDEIKEWLLNPNGNDTWHSLCKMWVKNLMVHGSLNTYKESMNGRIENIYELAGGTVIPMKGMYVGGANAYVQVISGMQPKIYYSDELSSHRYLPDAAFSYGSIPLEALINKIAETMLFDQLMAEQADGTRPPQKMIIVADNSPFGDLKNEFKVPVSEDEQKRLETKVNQPKKNAIMTFSGNTVQVVDLSRENTMAFQNERQKDVKSDVAMIFQASDLEMNLAGSANTSGRNTAEVQQELMHSGGILPILQTITTMITREILPFRYGSGYLFEFSSGKNEREELEIATMKSQTGAISINEIRESLGLDNLGPEFDKPIQQAAVQAGTDGQGESGLGL